MDRPVVRSKAKDHAFVVWLDGGVVPTLPKILPFKSIYDNYKSKTPPNLVMGKSYFGQVFTYDLAVKYNISVERESKNNQMFYRFLPRSSTELPDRPKF